MVIFILRLGFVRYLEKGRLEGRNLRLAEDKKFMHEYMACQVFADGKEVQCKQAG